MSKNGIRSIIYADYAYVDIVIKIECIGVFWSI